MCSRIKHESSSSDEEHTATKPASTGHLPLLSSVSYKKTLRLTSEQLVSPGGALLTWGVQEADRGHSSASPVYPAPLCTRVLASPSGHASLFFLFFSVFYFCF